MVLKKAWSLEVWRARWGGAVGEMGEPETANVMGSRVGQGIATPNLEPSRSWRNMGEGMKKYIKLIII